MQPQFLPLRSRESEETFQSPSGKAKIIGDSKYHKQAALALIVSGYCCQEESYRILSRDPDWLEGNSRASAMWNSHAATMGGAGPASDPTGSGSRRVPGTSNG